MQDGVLNVGQVACAESALCDSLRPAAAVVYYPAGQVTAQSGRPVHSLDAQEIAAAALQLLPPLTTLTEIEYQVSTATDNTHRDRVPGQYCH